MESHVTTKPSKDKRLRVALDMPTLHKKMPGQEYDLEHDEVIAWIREQPELLSFLAGKLKEWGYIVYDPETGTWSGAGHGG